MFRNEMFVWTLPLPPIIVAASRKHRSMQMKQSKKEPWGWTLLPLKHEYWRNGILIPVCCSQCCCHVTACEHHPKANSWQLTFGFEKSVARTMNPYKKSVRNNFKIIQRRNDRMFHVVNARPWSTSPTSTQPCPLFVKHFSIRVVPQSLNPTNAGSSVPYRSRCQPAASFMDVG